MLLNALAILGALSMIGLMFLGFGLFSAWLIVCCTVAPLSGYIAYRRAA